MYYEYISQYKVGLWRELVFHNYANLVEKGEYIVVKTRPYTRLPKSCAGGQGQ